MGFTFHFRSRNRHRPAGAVGKIGSSIFFLIFLGMGLLFCVLLVRDAFGQFQVLGWPGVECRIERSSADREKEKYVFNVRYTYDLAGRKYTGSTFRRSYKGSDDYSEAQALLTKYPKGATATGYINPAQADESVLERRFPYVIFAIFLPLIFVAIGAGGIYFTWRSGLVTVSEESTISSGSLTENNRRTGVGLMGFFGLFLLIGLATLYFMTIRTGLRIYDARAWPQVPCKIISAEVKSHSGDDSTTYSVDILYEYTIEGQKYRSNRYDFFGGSSSGRASKQKVVNEYRKKNAKFFCYVNPADPHDAVLQREVTAMAWLGAIPFGFILFGGVGMYAIRRHMNQESMTAMRNFGRVPMTRQQATGPVVLKAQQSPLAKLIFITLFALFWNGIISIFVTMAVRSWSTKSPEIFLSIFMIPFVLVGLALLGGAVYCALGLLNPRVALTLNSQRLNLGEHSALQWTFTGRYDRIQRLKIKLEAREEATYTRGTDSVTDKHVFFTQTLIDTPRQIDIVKGAVKFSIPADSMHSLEASRNKIVWSVEVHGEIPRWPDVKEEFKLTVLPMDGKAVRS